MPYNKRFADTLYNHDWLRLHYVDKKWSAMRIARKLECYPSAVIQRLQQADIETRSRSEAQKICPHPGSHAPRPKKGRDTIHNELWLRTQYESKGLNASEIARLAGVSAPTVFWALDKFGIEIKSASEAKKGRRNPKRRVALATACKSTLMNRANAVCPPGPCSLCTEGDTVVHHIDRDLMNPAPENLERLCPRCHRRQHRKEGTLAIRILRRRGVPTLLLNISVRSLLGLDRSPGRHCRSCLNQLVDVNHRDRDHDNDAPENKELLCRKHHNWQHNAEETLAVHILCEVYGFSIQRLRRRVRKILLRSLLRSYPA